MKKSQALAQQISAKAKEQRALLEKGADISADEMKRATELGSELKGLRTDYEAASTLERESEESAKFAEGLEQTGVNMPPHAGGKSTQAQVETLTPAGETVFERGVDEKGRRYIEKVYEEGESVLDEKTRAAISTTDYKRTFRNYLRKGIQALGVGELKTLQEGSDTQGGFLVPDDILNMIIQRKPAPTRIAGLVTRLQTSRDRLLIPKVNYSADDIYTTGVRATFTGEIPSSSTVHRVTDPVFGQVAIPVHTAMLSMPLTNDMIEDAAFPIVSWSSQKFQETIDLLYDNMILNGSGIGQPSGILMNPGGTDQPDVVVSGSGAALTGDGLWDLVYSLPEQYDENARMILNKTNAGRAIAKLKDSQNRYLFGYGDQDSGLSGARPKELCGYSYLYSAFMPNVGANAFPVAFGDFTGYYHVQRVGFSIQVLRELYAETNQQLLLGRVRFGGQVAESFKLKIQKCST